MTAPPDYALLLEIAGVCFVVVLVAGLAIHWLFGRKP